MGRQLENAAFWRIDAVYSQLSGTFTRIGKWIQSVDAAGKSAFSTTGRSGNENSLTWINVQIDPHQCGTFLGTVLKRKIFKRNNRRFFLSHVLLPQ